MSATAVEIDLARDVFELVFADAQSRSPGKREALTRENDRSTLRTPGCGLRPYPGYLLLAFIMARAGAQPASCSPKSRIHECNRFLCHRHRAFKQSTNVTCTGNPYTHCQGANQL